jgi:hypothetical protein
MTSDEIRVLALDVQPMCAEYGIQTRLMTTHVDRALALDEFDLDT